MAEVDLSKLNPKERKKLVENMVNSCEADRWSFVSVCKHNNPETGRPFRNLEEYMKSDFDTVERKLLRIRADQLIAEVSPSTLTNMSIIMDHFMSVPNKKFNYSHEAYVQMLKEAEDRMEQEGQET